MARAGSVPRETQQDIITLGLADVPPVEIHAKLGCKVSLMGIYRVLHQARAAGQPIRKFPPRRRQTPGGIVVRVTVWKNDRIGTVIAAAKARGVTTTRLINDLVDVMLSGQISIDAMLDDGVVTDAAR